MGDILSFIFIQDWNSHCQIPFLCVVSFPSIPNLNLQQFSTHEPDITSRFANQNQTTENLRGQ
jgi:hypothetical protein